MPPGITDRRVIMTLSEALQSNLDHGANQIEMDLGNGWELGMLSNALIASVKNYDDEFHQQGLIFSMEANGPVMSYRRDLTDAEGYLTGEFQIYYPFIID